MPGLYYRDPQSGEWKKFATTEVEVGNEVEISTVRPAIDPEGREIWINPGEEAVAGDGWYYMDQRYISRSGDYITGPLTLSGDPTEPMQAATKDYVDNIKGVPTGTIAMWYTAQAPTGWLLCDGAQHFSQDLFDVLQDWRTPDLRGRFVLAAAAALGYPLAQKSGLSEVTLTVPNMPEHDHGGKTGNESAGHYHDVAAKSVTTGGPSVAHAHHVPAKTVTVSGAGTHVHTVSINEGLFEEGMDGTYVDTNRNSQDPPSVKNVGTTTSGGGGHTHSGSLAAFDSNNSTDAHTHTGTVPGQKSGWQEQNHTHSITKQGQGTPVKTMPPYTALNFIIKD